MSFTDFAQNAVDACFDTFGSTATYTPPGGGSAVPCVVIINSPDTEIDLPQGRPVIETNIIEVRKSEIAAPAKDGIFVAEGRTYKVLSKPEAKDPERLVWTMSVR